METNKALVSCKQMVVRTTENSRSIVKKSQLHLFELIRITCIHFQHRTILRFTYGIKAEFVMRKA